MGRDEFSPFSIWSPVEKAVRQHGEWLVRGPLNSSRRDAQGEEIDIDALRHGLKYFDEVGGPVDWEHLYQIDRNNSHALIGEKARIYDAPHPRTGEVVPWLEARLYRNNALAKAAVNILKAKGKLGWSIAGGGVKNRETGKIMPIVATVGLTRVPVDSWNAGCIELVKALEGWSGSDRLTSEMALPFVPEIRQACPQLLKALEATGFLPRQGPGIDAVGVEDLHGVRESKERRKRRRKRLAASLRTLAAYHVAARLADHVPVR